MTNERWIRWTKNERIVALKAKTYSYLKGNNDGDKKAKGTKKCVIKRKIKFQDNKNWLEPAQFENKKHHLEKNKIDVDKVLKNS